jgi:hypothetical protein
MSSDNLNETTKNFLKAISEYKLEPVKPIVIKLTYDPITNIVNGCTYDDTDEPWIEITREQYELGIHYKKLKVVNGKLEEIPRIKIKQLALVEGSRWFTTKENMLIIGDERGWDERRSS